MSVLGNAVNWVKNTYVPQASANLSAALNPISALQTGGTVRNAIQANDATKGIRTAITGGKGLGYAVTGVGSTPDYQHPASTTGPVMGPPKPAVTPAINTNTDPTNMYGGANSGASSELAALNAKQAQVDAARASYLAKYGLNKQAEADAQQFATDSYNTNAQRASDQKNTLQQGYDTQTQQMTTADTTAKNSLASAYSSRGLGDSSFAGKANANEDISFHQNLAALGTDRAAKFLQIDNYLSDLKASNDEQARQVVFSDSASEIDKADSLRNLDAQSQQIDAQKASIRTAAATAASGIGGVQGANQIMQFQTDISKVLSTVIPAAQKQTILAGLYKQAGNSNPEQYAKYSVDYYDTTNRIQNLINGSNNPSQTEQTAVKDANNNFQKLYGIQPFQVQMSLTQ